MIPLITDMSQSILLALSCAKITQLLVRSPLVKPQDTVLPMTILDFNAYQIADFFYLLLIILRNNPPLQSYCQNNCQTLISEITNKIKSISNHR